MLTSQYTAPLDRPGYLSKAQIFCLMATDPMKGGLYPDTPEWVIEECRDLRLVTPGEMPGSWKLSPDGWDVWRALLAD